MRIEASYPVIVTARLQECRDFYMRWFDFVVAFEVSWFVLLITAEEPATTLAFMHPEHPSSPPSPAPYAADGSFITFQVADARAEYERLAGAGFAADLEPDEPWGQRRFGVVDPAGMWVDVVEQIDPAEGWWDRYIAG